MPGHEIARLAQLDGGWTLNGTSLFGCREGPCKLEYAVICDARWQTLAARVRGMIGPQPVDLEVSIDECRRWYWNGAECAAVEGSADLDLAFSPATNLLPIRRLALPVGGEAEVKAAWLAFPSLELEVRYQTYRRTGELMYRYESGQGSFVRSHEVNPAGFATDYPGQWKIGSGGASAEVR